MPLTADDSLMSTPPATPVVETEVDCWAPENWLSYRGDQRPTVGAVMGPRHRRRGHEHDAFCTVVAARYEPGHDWGDGGILGRTQLGLVTGDVTAELARQITYTITGADDEPLQHVVLCAMRPVGGAS